MRTIDFFHDFIAIRRNELPITLKLELKLSLITVKTSICPSPWTSETLGGIRSGCNFS
jgi:hypothetical protein